MFCSYVRCNWKIFVNYNSHKTAIRRNKPSAPCKVLFDKNLIVGRVLDYGCGRGDDVEFLGCIGYDKYFQPTPPTGLFDTILCTYVLNTIPSWSARESLIKEMREYLAPNGKLYITVRSVYGVPVKSSRGTYQVLCMYHVKYIPHLLYRSKDFRIYEFSNSAA